MERRHFARRRVLKGGKLVLDRDVCVLNCVIRNLSDYGACIELASTLRVPDEFKLSFDSSPTVRQCLVRWRSKMRLGVAFS
jgi:hypothetical protein